MAIGAFMLFVFLLFFFFFNDTATTEIYTLSLHDALPISRRPCRWASCRVTSSTMARARSEEHTSELQSQFHLVCRLLLEKKKNKKNIKITKKKKKSKIKKNKRVKRK